MALTGGSDSGSLAYPTEPSFVDPEKRDELAKMQFAGLHLPASLLGGGERFIKDLIDRAMSLEAKGAKPSEIFRDTAGRVKQPDVETGIYRNPANQWQFGLSDKGARLSPEAEAALYPRFGGGGVASGDLSDLYRNPELFARMPELGGIPTKLTEPSGPAKYDASYWSRGGSDRSGRVFPRGNIEAYAPSPAQDQRSIMHLLTHELQHGVQDYGGLPRGGGEEDLDLLYGKINTQVPGARDLARQLMGQGLENDPLRLIALAQGGAKGSRPGFSPFTRAVSPTYTNYDTYLSLAGETQARQAAAEHGMSAAEMMQVPPFLPDIPKGILPQPAQLIRTGQQDFAMPDQAALERYLRERR